jgi:hypothetical protein
MVGARGFEPRASCAQGRRATRLRYAPTVTAIHSKARPNPAPHPYLVFAPDCARTVHKWINVP